MRLLSLGYCLLFLGAVSAAASAFAPAPLPRPGRRGGQFDDSTALQGRWRMVSCVSGGVTTPGSDDAAVTVSGDRLSLSTHDFVMTLDAGRRLKEMHLKG